MSNFYTFAPGVDTSFSSKLNTNFTAACGISSSILVGTSLNIAAFSSATTTVSNDLSYTIGPVNDFLKVSISFSGYYASASGSSNYGQQISSIYIKSADLSSTSFSTLATYTIGYTTLRAPVSSSNNGCSDSNAGTIDYYIVPSVTQRTSGFQLKITSEAAFSPNGGAASEVNISVPQIVLWAY
jgi:hypothetical protein